jgi:hypothetical protein
MKRRIAVLAGIVAMLTLGFGCAQTFAMSATPVTELRVEWEKATRSGRPLIRGYVYNQHQMRAENVRLRVEQLDAAANPVAARTTYVVGTIPYRDRGYFEVPVASADATYRVSIESFDRAGCGNG